jgi:hypothetical protein
MFRALCVICPFGHSALGSSDLTDHFVFFDFLSFFLHGSHHNIVFDNILSGSIRNYCKEYYTMSSPSHFQDEHYTPIAITAALPPVVTIPAHGLSNGQRIRCTRFYGIPFATATGMEQLNNRLFTIQQVTTDTFQLWDDLGFAIDGRNFTPFVFNGLAQMTLTGPSLFIQNPAPPTPPDSP